MTRPLPQEETAAGRLARRTPATGPIAPHRPLLDRLNPVVRLGCAILLALPILVTLDWLSSVVMLGLEVVVFSLTGSGPTRLWRHLAPVLLVGLIASGSMALYGRPGGAVYWHWWIVTVSHQSLLMAGAVFLRIMALALAASELLGRIDPTRMADGLAQLVRLPARFVLGSLAGVRMLGLLHEDWRTLALARRARGLGDRGAVRRFLSMAFTLLVFAIRRATKLAVSMEVRGFTTESSRHRTWARPSTLSRADLAGLVTTLAMCGLTLGVALAAGTFWLIWTGPPR